MYKYGWLQPLAVLVPEIAPEIRAWETLTFRVWKNMLVVVNSKFRVRKMWICMQLCSLPCSLVQLTQPF